MSEGSRFLNTHNQEIHYFQAISTHSPAPGPPDGPAYYLGARLFPNFLASAAS